VTSFIDDPLSRSDLPSQFILCNRLSKSQLLTITKFYSTATSIAFGGGTVLGWTSPTSVELLDPNGDYRYDEEGFSWIGSSLNLGAVATCLPIGILINIIGRKWSLLILIVPALAGKYQFMSSVLDDFMNFCSSRLGFYSRSWVQLSHDDRWSSFTWSLCWLPLRRLSIIRG
jgi:MFS family permease